MECPISELVEADAEVGCGEIAVRFRFAVLFAEEDVSGFGGPGDGQSERNEESIEFSRIGEPGIFEVEAAGFDVAEGALDGPAFLAGFKRALGFEGGGEDRECAIFDAFCGEAQGQSERLIERGRAAMTVFRVGPMRRLQSETFKESFWPLSRSTVMFSFTRSAKGMPFFRRHSIRSAPMNSRSPSGVSTGEAPNKAR